MSGELTGKIFEDWQRTDPRPNDGIESQFRFLDRVDQPFYSAIRGLINDWFAHIPEGDDKGDVAARLRGDDVNHTAAFWELWIHEFLLRSGFNVVIHPECPDGRRRDFRAGREEGAFYLEAHCFFDSPEKRGESRRLAELERQLRERLELPFHSLLLNVRGVGASAVSAKSFAKGIQAAARQVRSMESQTVAQLRTGDGWDVLANLFGLPNDGPGLPVTDVNLIKGGAGTVQDLHIEPLRRAVATKAADASRLDLPYVVAVNFCHEEHYLLRPIDIHQALVGTETVVLSQNLERAAVRRNRDGTFLRGDAPHTTAVSGLILAEAMAPDFAGTYLPTLHLHDHALRPLTVELPLPVARHANDPEAAPSTEAGPLSANELFGLPKGWPGSQTFEKPYWPT